MIANALPSREYLSATFDYDTASGCLRWRVREDVPAKWNGRFAGTVAGSKVGGRVVVIIHGRHLKAHRIIWKMVHGDEPNEIDHIDGDPLNNRIGNLRPATREQNMRNVRGRAVSGVKGVCFHPRSGLWRARVRVGGKEVCQYRKTLDEAAVAYAEMATRHYGEFARLA